MGQIRERRLFGVYGRHAVAGDEVFVQGLPGDLAGEFLAESMARDTRSVLINAGAAGASIALYQRLGFTGEMY